MAEVHARPDEALSDGAQSLKLDEYEQMVRELRAIHEVIT
jgi:3-deoxy-D-arabino-heptulosonate 7-phosphate (DAHP) synthase